MTDAYVETCKGRRFYPGAPVFDIEEIAHSLSMLCRFGGHCSKFYSVAEHSLLVARIMDHLDLGDPVEGLLHDGTESAMADICSPVKALLSEYKALERQFDQALRKQFELPEELSAGCKTADWVALALEAEQLMPTRGRDWYMPEGVRELSVSFKAKCRPGLFLRGWIPAQAEASFLMAAQTYGVKWNG